MNKNNIIIDFTISQVNNLIEFIDSNLIEWVVAENLNNDETDRLCDLCASLKILKEIRDNYNKGCV